MLGSLTFSRYRVTVVILARSEYTPGTPGAAWNQWELLTVRAKLWRLYSDNDVAIDWWKSNWDNRLGFSTWLAEVGFFPAKVVRLRWV